MLPLAMLNHFHLSSPGVANTASSGIVDSTMIPDSSATFFPYKLHHSNSSNNTIIRGTASMALNADETKFNLFKRGIQE
jgi:hypothetical protein